MARHRTDCEVRPRFAYSFICIRQLVQGLAMIEAGPKSGLSSFFSFTERKPGRVECWKPAAWLDIE
jgi:hypothetical protein